MKDVSLVVYPTADLTTAKQFFRELIGADPYVDSPHYVGYKSGDTEIGLVPSAGDADREPLVYWTVTDIAASIAALEACGGSIARATADVGYGMLVATVKTPTGATVGLRQPPTG